MKKYMILLLCLSLCLLAACAEKEVPETVSVETHIAETTEEETETETETEAETTQAPTETEEPETSSSEEEEDGILRQRTVSAVLHHDAVGNVWLQFLASYENTGDRPLRLDYADVTLSAAGMEDLVLTAVSPFPEILNPGETGYYYEEKQVDLDDSLRLTARMEPQPEEAGSPVRYEAKDIQIKDAAYGLEVSGVLEEAARKEQNLICVAAVLLDKDLEPFAVLYDYFSMEGEDGSFILSGERLPEDVRAEDAARCLIFAYPYEE